jgi:16S rRNA (guanine527-N7)-methyltransferase
MTSRDFQDRLLLQANHAGVTIDSALAEKLEGYFRLLARWNRKINLTGMDLAEPTPGAVDRLLIEPLVAAKHAPAGVARLIDIGSGGGSPAIPFALATRPHHLVMVESKTRKSIFLKEASRALRVDSEVLTSRFEDLVTRPDLHEVHDLLTIRAVRVHGHSLMSLQGLVRPGGQMFLFRSATAHAEEEANPQMTHATHIPLVASSSLLILRKSVPRGTNPQPVPTRST